ncbi:MAG: DUF6273 domain-containing protein [Clostridia bacterium]|nr:DUF6273 domain-containing protein [Clostridia bacterium]
MKRITAILLVLSILVLGVSVASAKTEVGDYIKFGEYCQNGRDTYATPIQWLVMDIQDGKAFVISRYGLFAHPFNSNSAGQTWADCTLREYLNDTFLSVAFTSKERKAIQTTNVDESKKQTSNAHPAKRIGPDTKDKIFLLSAAEIMNYLEKADRKCKPTESTKDGGCYLKGGCTWYWLRSPAYSNNACVIDENGNIDTCYISHTYGVVRPCCWVDLDAIGY